MICLIVPFQTYSVFESFGFIMRLCESIYK